MSKPPPDESSTTRLSRMFSDLATGVTAVELCRGNKDARVIVAAAMLDIAAGTLADDGMSRERFLKLAAQAFDLAREDVPPPPVGHA